MFKLRCPVQVRLEQEAAIKRILADVEGDGLELIELSRLCKLDEVEPQEFTYIVHQMFRAGELTRHEESYGNWQTYRQYSLKRS